MAITPIERGTHPAAEKPELCQMAVSPYYIIACVHSKRDQRKAERHERSRAYQNRRYRLPDRQAHTLYRSRDTAGQQTCRLRAHSSRWTRNLLCWQRHLACELHTGPQGLGTVLEHGVR